ncbi:MAG: hypothetical protein ACON5N_03355 [Akkermansiaceae bacterium]
MKRISSFFALALPSVAIAELKLDPTLHLNVAATATSADDPADVAAHAHDPNDDLSLQGFDFGLNVHYDNWLSGFFNANAFTTADGRMDAEWEESFLKFQELPGNFEIRAGRYLNRFGLQNNKHQHAWDFVNSNLSTPAFLGEEGLITEGGELTWIAELDRGFFALSGSFGRAVDHDHHGHGDEHDDDHDDDHDDGDDHDEEEHGEHGGEEAYFSGDVATIRALLTLRQNDFHQHHFGLNGAWGENGFDRDTSLYSADYVYQWRENGLEPGGREFSAGVEFFYRDVEWADEDEGLSGDTSQNGFMVFGQYRFTDQWITDLRYEDIQGKQPLDDLSLGEDRERISVALTREFEIADSPSYARIQYSHDDLEDGSEDTFWLQFGFSFGPAEVR